MNQRMGRPAQDEFKLLCSRAEITCNQSIEDDYGWDFLLEVPPKSLLRSPADKIPAAKVAFVQIKSTRGTRRRAEMKVSSALQLAKKPEPCFLVLFHERKDGRHVYARLFGKKDIGRTLKRARNLSVQGKEAHKAKMTFGFSEDEEHTNDLVNSIIDRVQGLGPEYSAEKRQLAETIGYENKNWVAEITIDGSRGLQDLVDLQLGLKDQLEVSRFAIFDERFGIETSTPVVEKSEKATLRMQPKKDIECVVVLETDHDTISMSSTVRLARAPGLEPGGVKLAFHNELFVLVMSTKGGSWDEVAYSIHDVRRKPLPIRVLENLATMLSWDNQDARVRVTGDLPDLQVDVRFWENPAPLDRNVAATLATLRHVATRSGTRDIALSMMDVASSYGMLTLIHAVVGEAKITLRTDQGDILNAPSKFHNLIGFMDVNVGDYTFFVVLDCAIEIRTDEQETLSIDLGRRNVRDCVVGKSRPTVCSQGKAAYERYAKSYGDDWLSIGSLSALIESSYEPR